MAATDAGSASESATLNVNAGSGVLANDTDGAQSEQQQHQRRDGDENAAKIPYQPEINDDERQVEHGQQRLAGIEILDRGQRVHAFHVNA